MMNPDLEFAKKLQAQFDQEAHTEMSPYLPPAYRSPQKQTGKLSVVSSDWETIDPTPDLHALFIEFNQTFFWGRLLSCEVRWSPRMTTCAGICRYSPRERFCTIGISIPLLKLRPRKDLVETLLHEMIHAYLFITDNNDDHDGHGPEFHKHMYRINKATGANISVYHTFHDEVALYKQHWWRCSGPCTRRPPFYGFVKRAMNRAPGPTDRWWAQHQNSCGGSFVKVKEPEGYGKKKGKENSKDKKPPGQRDIRSLFGSGGGSRPSSKPATTNRRKKTSPIKTPAQPTGKPGKSPVKGGGRGNIFGFGGSSFKSPGGSSQGGLKTAGKSGTFVVKPGWKTSDNSSGGSVVNIKGTSSSQGGTSTESQSSGNTVGGTVSGKLSARDMARLKWANATPKAVTNNGRPRKSVIKSSNPKSKVPDKSSKGDESDSSLTHRESTASGSVESSSSDHMAGCPVCGKSVPAKNINEHLDACLVNQNERNDGEIIDVDEDLTFDDEDDTLLLKAADEADQSVIMVPGDDDDASVQIDSDKEPKTEDSTMDESMNQDDLDLLAAFSDIRDDYNEDFACPVCQKLVANLEMNAHLDKCIG